MKTTSSPEWRAASVVVRPIYSDVPEIHVVGRRVAISAEHMTAVEAATRWTEAVAGRVDIGGPSLAYSLLGDRIDAFWVASGETWAQGRRASFPEYQVTWVIEGASNLVSSGDLWEPVEDQNRHFPSAWDVIYPYVLGLPYKPGTNAYMNGAAAVRLPYPVALSEVTASGTELTVRVDEDLAGRAAGHLMHVSYRTSSDQTIQAILETSIDSPRLYAIRLNAPPVHWSVTLISPDGIRRDFTERTETAATAPATVPYPSIGAILRKPGGLTVSERHDEDTTPEFAPLPGVTNDPGRTDSQIEAEAVAPDFSRISDPENADLLAQRWREAVLCLGVGASLSAIAMMGSLLEGALLQMAIRHPSEANRTSAAPRDGNKPRPWSQWRLTDLINVAAQAKWISVDLQDFSVVLRDYRNLLHPWESKAKAFHPTPGSAAICWEITRRVVDQLIAHEALTSEAGRHSTPARKLTNLPRRSAMGPGSKSITDYVRDQRR